ncbi:S-adenosylhomocysteine hydrolase [Paraburkholderia sp. 5N]|uniref:S-adenosylhomocysteine hydrolase n=1 Tax=Paraburkholderia elongata TaxID=2675747 RepID=A0A972NTH5_9BURK|nr:S-adenosylhomocysteine hydrolase [Paraburkholderia elongata]
MRVEDKIVRSIRRRKDVVLLRSELAPMGSVAQVGRVLAKLVGDGRLVRVSIGVYAKTRVNKFTGKLAPSATFEAIAAETFKKLRIQVSLGRLARDYNAGLTTQIPMDGVVCTGKRRISRKIQVGTRTVKYENSSG